MKTAYASIKERDVPTGVRFDTPARNQGQIVERAYGGFRKGEHDDDDPYMRVVDRSRPLDPPKYYRRISSR